ncbi:hypothetical protein ACFPN2_37450 [Steroidobacter flavus]|uniref:Uncharacterized protein n=1 Tax=Steroidobacter flavus TaxID=1842136 RepID=A0ABV8T4E8_9GAMM
MRPRPESVKILAAKSPDEVALWLARGFFETAAGFSRDPFAPHSFINLAAHPAEGVESLYAVAPPGLQRALRVGITILGRYCRYESPESELLDEQQRLRLLTEFLRLASNLICIPAAPIVARIATEDARHWSDDVFVSEVFPACCVCLQTLGLRFDESGYADLEETLRDDVEIALYQVVMKKKHFNVGFAPRTLAALINVTPRNLIHHLELLGRDMLRMHRQEPEQRRLSHLTATRIVEKEFNVLQDQFPKLHIARAISRDAWLLEALFGPEGPLIYWGNPKRERRITVALRTEIKRRAIFFNEGFATARMPPGTPPPDNLYALALIGQLETDFFDAASKVPLADSWASLMSDRDV